MSDIDSSVPVTSNPQTGSPPAAPAPVAEPVERHYRVYEERGDRGLAFVAEVTADDKDAARWVAVDAVPELAARCRAHDGESGEPVPLVAIARRYAGEAVPTFEEVVPSTVRR